MCLSCVLCILNNLVLRVFSKLFYFEKRKNYKSSSAEEYNSHWKQNKNIGSFAWDTLIEIIKSATSAFVWVPFCNYSSDAIVCFIYFFVFIIPSAMIKTNLAIVRAARWMICGIIVEIPFCILFFSFFLIYWN